MTPYTFSRACCTRLLPLVGHWGLPQHAPCPTHPMCIQPSPGCSRWWRVCTYTYACVCARVLRAYSWVCYVYALTFAAYHWGLPQLHAPCPTEPSRVCRINKWRARRQNRKAELFRRWAGWSRAHTHWRARTLQSPFLAWHTEATEVKTVRHTESPGRLNAAAD